MMPVLSTRLVRKTAAGRFAQVLWRIRYVSCVATFALTAALGTAASAEIFIGAAGPMTGRMAWLGEQLQRGVEMAVADVNAEGGVLGEQVFLVTADDYCDPEQAVAAAQKLVNDGVIFVVGHFCSEASIPASEVYEAAGIVQISPGSTNPKLTEQGRRNVFRTIGRDDAQGAVAGNYLADNWADKRIAIFHDGTTYGKGLADETKKQLNKRGVVEALFQAYLPNTDDYSAELAALVEAEVAVLYVGGRHVEAALIARAARDRGYPLQLVAGDAIATEEFALVAGAAADGTLFTFSPEPSRYPEAAPLVARFRAENFEPAGYTLLAYAAVQAWAQAVAKAGSLKSEVVIASLHDHEFDTVLGRTGFDEKGDVTGASWIWYVWKDDAYVPVE
jgi:branched-chain amino acid transport system substrate-binding protein